MSDRTKAQRRHRLAAPDLAIARIHPKGVAVITEGGHCATSWRVPGCHGMAG
jgi:hypothetical protein